MSSIPQTLIIVAAVAGALAAWAAVIVTVLIFLWNKLDKRFDDLRSDLKDGLGKLEAKVDRLLKSRLPTPR